MVHEIQSVKTAMLEIKSRIYAGTIHIYRNDAKEYILNRISKVLETLTEIDEGFNNDRNNRGF